VRCGGLKRRARGKEARERGGGSGKNTRYICGSETIRGQGTAAGTCDRARTRGRNARGRERACNAHQQKQAQLPTAGAHGEESARRGRNRDMASNLIVENERCVGASEGRLGQLREIIRNGEHGGAHGARQGQATGCSVTSAGILDKAVGRGETCI
jgi:hypothetical protein